MILKEAQFGGKFPKAEWKVYMSSEKSLIGLIRKDENYVENIIIDTLSETKQVKVHEQRRLIDSSK